MAGVTKENVVEFIENMTVIELSEFVKELEEKFGVSAAAPVAVAAAGAAPAAGWRRGGRREDRIHRYFERGRREQDKGHQRGKGCYESRPEGSQGTGRRRAQTPQRGCQQG